MRTLKTVLLRGLAAPGVPGLFSPLLRARATVFMLHRFATPDLGVVGHEPDQLRRVLGYLRRQRYEILGLPELFDRLGGEGPPLLGAVAFTLDDGYFDQALAGSVFAEFDCPATTFVTSGFLDGTLWMWWDKVEYVFERTARHELSFDMGDRTVSYRWNTRHQKDAARNDFTERCKAVSDAAKHAGIDRLAAAAEVDLPAQVPPRYAPMSWDQLLACEDRGMSFGPHTVTHPVLSQATDEQSRREILESWERLQAQATRPVPIFSYPNGQESDFGDRELSVIRTARLRGAVVGTPGYASMASFAAKDGPFKVRRFGYQEDLPHVIQCVSGVERLKGLMRSSA